MTTAELQTTAVACQAEQHLVAGRYRMQDRMGRGRLGEIFSATDERYRQVGAARHVALQLMPESVVRNNKLFNRISQGYAALRAAAHPNIVRYLDFGRDAGFAYLTMERLDGASLRQALGESGPLPLDEVKPVIRGIGQALRLLHGRNIVHGNLTTSSVFITDELEARLLDVVPLDATDAVFRTPATSDPFARRSARDDVFGLACLAYEMLTARHPFGHCLASESGSSGCVVERIPSLPDREWKALRAALSGDDANRTDSIAAFMAHFGIKGTERLRPAPEIPVAPPAAAATLCEDLQQPAASAVPVARAVATPPAVVVDDFLPQDDRLAAANTAKKGRSPLQAVILGLLLAGIGAWVTYGDPGLPFADRFGRFDGGVEAGPPSANAETASPGGDATPGRPDAPVQANTAEAAVPDRVPETGEVAVATESGPASPASPPTSDDTAGTGAGAPAAAEHTPTTATGPVTATPGPIVVESVVSVSERDGAARIAPQLVTNPASPLVWWTSEYTATAGTDFVSEGQQVFAGQRSDDGIVLHVPLVNDSVPEPRESFFVNFGIRDTGQGHIERIATVRVDIVDDDSP